VHGGGVDVRLILIVLGLSVGVVALFHRLRLPSIAGFILVGALCGPHGMWLVSDPEDVAGLAELGVVLLLFSIGLEFSMSRLRRTWRILLEAGAAYVGLAGVGSYLVALALGLGHAGAIFVGFWISLSSTAIVLKTLSQRQELDAPHGRLSLSILLFQDLCIVPMMLLLPVLAGVRTAGTAPIARTLVESLVIILVVLLVSRFVVPRFLTYLAHTRNRELFLIFVLLICLGTAALSSSLGLSAALGAFIAGLLLSKSDYGLQALSDILPFRDIFNSIFFMSVGMLLDLGYCAAHPMEVTALGLGILVGKTLVGFLVALLVGFPARVAALTAVALSQVGEFSFVLAQAGGKLDLLPAGIFQGLLASSILTMAVTPVLIAVAPSMARRVERVRPVVTLRGRRAAPGMEESEAEKMSGHVVLVGYGVNGRNVARLLADAKIRYLVVDLNARVVRHARENGQPIVFGDVTSEGAVRHLGLDRARVVVLSISDAEATRRAVRRIRSLAAKLAIIVRTRYVAEVDELRALGADEVVPEEFETSLEIGARTLSRFGIPIDEIHRRLEEVRSDHYRALRPPDPSIAGPSGQIPGQLDTITIGVPASCPIAGLSLREIDMQGRTGGTILAIVRDGDPLANPNPSMVLEVNDTLVVMGSPDQVDAARAIASGEIAIEPADDRLARED
jgi:CPA2 family monovalent cation:H+ antiporter-2